MSRMRAARIGIRVDGTEIVAGPGDITSSPSGHEGWVIGDESARRIDC
jgi:hypothetical protein